MTAWCAQHDADTDERAWARSSEPPSISGGESVSIVRFLMSIEEPTPEIVAAIAGAARWLESVAMQGVRLESIRGDDGRTERRLAPDPDAPPLRATFHELGTNRPLYLDRDSIFRYDFTEISDERRSDYSYHGTWAARLLTRDCPAATESAPAVTKLTGRANGVIVESGQSQRSLNVATRSVKSV